MFNKIVLIRRNTQHITIYGLLQINWLIVNIYIRSLIPYLKLFAALEVTITDKICIGLQACSLKSTPSKVRSRIQ